MEHGKCRGKDITTHKLCCEAMVYRITSSLLIGIRTLRGISASLCKETYKTVILTAIFGCGSVANLTMLVLHHICT